jgi:hypothetical protein
MTRESGHSPPEPDDEDPDARLAAAGEALAEAIEAAVPSWVERRVRDLLVAYAGRADAVAVERARAAGRRAAAELGPELRRLLGMDVDRQRANPLALVRRAVSYPTEVLAAAGVPPVVRDDYDEAHFPDDVYGLTPWTFTDLDPSLRDVALVWGAAKARASMVRHR